MWRSQGKHRIIAGSKAPCPPKGELRLCYFLFFKLSLYNSDYYVLNSSLLIKIPLRRTRVRSYRYSALPYISDNHFNPLNPGSETMFA